MVQDRDQEYLHGYVIAIRYSSGGRFFLLHPRSSTVMRTDALGAYAARLFILGHGSEDIADRVERRCPGAAQRWRRLVVALHNQSATTAPRPLRGSRWWLQRLLMLLLSIVLSLTNALLRHLPVRVLKLLYNSIPHTPVGTRAVAHLLPVIDRNLLAAGYADRSDEWRAGIAREVGSAMVRTRVYTYFSQILSANRLQKLARVVTQSPGQVHVRRVIETGNGAIVVALHWDTFQAPLVYLSDVRPVTLLASRGQPDYSLACDRKPGDWHFARRVDNASRTTVRTLLDDLTGGRVVIIPIDVGVADGLRNGLDRRVSFLGRSVTRFDLIGWLAVHSGKPLMVVNTHRRGSVLEVEASPPFKASPECDPVRLTTEVYRYAEQRIRENPGAWLVWGHLHTLTAPGQDAAREPAAVTSLVQAPPFPQV